MNESYNQRYEDLQERFRARCRSDADQLRHCLTGSVDLEAAEHLLHRLAGSGATFGYPEVSTQAKLLENRVVDGGVIAGDELEAIISLLKGLR